MNYLEVTVKTTEEMYESVANIFWESGAGGVVIEDPRVIRNHIAEDNWDAWEFPEELLEQEEIVIKGYFSVDASLVETVAKFKGQIEALIKHFPDGRIEITETEVAAENWATSWKAFYRVEKIGAKVVIKPSWEQYDRKPEDVVVELDPGMAFGTGNHPTTVMCIRALEKLVFPGCRVLDIGTGSGVLAITAAKLGAGQIIAIDQDPVSIDAARENVGLNDVGDRIKVQQGDLASDVKEKADIIIANIIADVVIKLTPQAARLIEPRGAYISSGIIKDRLPDVMEALKANSFQVEKTFYEGEWAAVLARRV
ncbi:MAG: 50S ribosomal protein L11 methyltransferase [Desulfitobacteriaceae bacterium]|nr:50S ribosomal protein L11 methyltransferase [Desulfitobacteriaceae bacterium]MDD4752687.1 50S ribosomal protein L11 methyltransferase [Desulfitobacteriaceae bacterium]